MIKALIFDFGDVFINLDKQGAMDHALDLFCIDHFEDDMIHINKLYEKGLITSDNFIAFYKNKYPKLSESRIISTWNFIIKDFPSYRLDFLKKLSAQHNFNLLLLSNTNELHIEYVKETVPFYDDFKTQFDQFYLSHEIHFRKPDTDIFEFLLSDNNLSAQECLFIDDTEENIITAKTLGFHTWHLDPVNEDVVTLFESCKRVFNYE